MKTTALFIAGAGILLAAVALVPGTSPSTAPAAAEALAIGRTPAARQDDTRETPNLTTRRKRPDTPREKPDSEDAVAALLAEVSSTHAGLVQSEIARLADQPPAELDEELAKIAHSVGEGVSVKLEDLGIDENRRASAVAAASDTIVAEIRYADAAPDPASRLALLWLDRERQSRAEMALALSDPTEQSQALAELEAWYEDGLGGIAAAGNPN